MGATKEELDERNELTHEDELAPVGCGILGRYPVLSVLAFALVGIAIGVGLSYWIPEDEEGMRSKDIALKWIGLIGDLFIRSLKAVVLPLVFVNVVISVVDMMNLGEAGAVGWKTIVLYLVTTVIASIIGIVTIVSFQSLFSQETFMESPPATVSLGCNSPDALIAEGADGSLSCTANYGAEVNAEFTIQDLTKTFVTASGGARDDISLSDTIYEGVFTKIVTSNITEAFYDGNFAAVVFLAIAFGIALSRVVLKKLKGEAHSAVMALFKELDGVFLTIINWIIMCTPFAVMSLIIQAIGSQEDLANSFANVGYLVVATMLAMVVQFFLVYCGLYFLMTRTNPFNYLKFMVPAQTMAFACASSAATIPMTLKCVKSTGKVPDPIARFVVPLGATVNMDGGAIYFPCACIWLAILNGITPNVGNYFLLIIISTIGSAGTAPVPSASLVLIITAYNTVFGTVGTPEGFSYILAIDWFMDRLRTTLNVTGDSVVCGIVSHITPEPEEEDLEKMEGVKSDQTYKGELHDASSEEDLVAENEVFVGNDVETEA